MTTSHPTDSSGTSWLLNICVTMASLRIVLVVVVFSSVDLLSVQDQFSVVFWYLMLILMSESLWIVMSLIVAHLSIKPLFGVLLLVLIGTLRWWSTSVIGFRCHTVIDSLYHYHIFHKIKSFSLSLNIPEFPWNLLFHIAWCFGGVKIMWVPFLLCR